jgi:hypothetical protein
MRGRTGLFPEEKKKMGFKFLEPCVLEKPHALAAMAVATAKRQEVTLLYNVILAVTDIARLFVCVRESCFQSKKVAKRFKRL